MFVVWGIKKGSGRVEHASDIWVERVTEFPHYTYKNWGSGKVQIIRDEYELHDWAEDWFESYDLYTSEYYQEVQEKRKEQYEQQRRQVR